MHSRAWDASNAAQDCLTGVYVSTGQLKMERSVIIVNKPINSTFPPSGIMLKNNPANGPAAAAVLEDTHIIVRTPRERSHGVAVDVGATLSASCCYIMSGAPDTKLYPICVPPPSHPRNNGSISLVSATS